VAFPYLKAVEGTGLGVRVMPIGAMHFGMKPWDGVWHLFTEPLKARYINVVAIEPGLPMGAAITTAQFGSPGSDDNTVYEPQLALSGLFTVGVPNVAILSGNTMPGEKEIEALKRYDEVICPDEKGEAALYKVGVISAMIPPESDLLSHLFSAMTPV
jgi:hypothetical protein